MIADMTTIASESTMSTTAVAPTKEMATSVLMVEWMVKQLQLLKEKQGQIESQQRQIEALLKEYVVEYVFGVPISQGSLAKMQRWFQESLEPSYQQWLSYVKQPGVRCVDETTYCIDGIKYWLWVATSSPCLCSAVSSHTE